MFSIFCYNSRMGYIQEHREKGIDDIDFFGPRFPDYKLLHAVSTRKACYIAAERDGKVIPFIVPFSRGSNLPNDWRSPEDYSYKIMNETDGPYQRECPEKILKALTPAEILYDITSRSYERAAGWRSRCWKNIVHRKSVDKRMPEKGAWVRFKNPITFTDNTRHQIMRFQGKNNFACPNGGRYILRGWKYGRTWQVLSEEQMESVLSA